VCIIIIIIIIIITTIRQVVQCDHTFLRPFINFPMDFLAILFLRHAAGWPAASTANLEDRVIFGQGFLPLALDKPISNCMEPVLVLVRPRYFISPAPAVSGGHSPSATRESADERLATPHYIYIYLYIYMGGRVAQSVQLLVTGWTVRGLSPGGGDIFRTCPDRLWGPPSLL
jgi:hypothetical protein